MNLKKKNRNVTPPSSSNSLSSARNRSRPDSSDRLMMNYVSLKTKHIFVQFGEKIQSEFVRNLWHNVQVVYQAIFVEKSNQIK